MLKNNIHRFNYSKLIFIFITILHKMTLFGRYKWLFDHAAIETAVIGAAAVLVD